MHTRRCNAQCHETAPVKPHISCGITHQTVTAFMRPATNFDDQSRLMAVKVGDIRPGGVLSPEFQSAGAPAKHLP